MGPINRTGRNTSSCDSIWRETSVMLRFYNIFHLLHFVSAAVFPPRIPKAAAATAWLSWRWNPTDILHAMSVSGPAVCIINLYYLARGPSRGRDSSVGIATDYAQDGISSISRQGFSPLHAVQTGSKAHTASCPAGIGQDLSLQVKWQGREANHSPPACAEVKKTWIYTTTPPYVLMAQCLIS
jgi:hypothetical protein